MRRTILALVLLAGCVTVQSTMLPRAGGPLDPVEPHLVNVLISPPDTLPHDCQRVAVLSAEGDVTYTDRQQMIDEMRREGGGDRSQHPVPVLDRRTGRASGCRPPQRGPRPLL